MNRRDSSEVFLWAAAAAVIGTAVLSASMVNSEDVPGAPISPAATIDGFTVTATVTADPVKHTATAVFSVPPAIPGNAATLSLNVELLKREYKGDPASRLMNPNDFVSTTVDEATVNVRTDGSKPGEERWTVEIPKPEGLPFMTSYQVAVRQGDDKVVLCGFGPVNVWPEATNTMQAVVVDTPAAAAPVSR